MNKIGKIKIQLKECCLDCDHFDTAGIKGFGSFIACCGEPERVIACGHMAVCKKYLESAGKIEVTKNDFDKS